MIVRQALTLEAEIDRILGENPGEDEMATALVFINGVAFALMLDHDGRSAIHYMETIQRRGQEIRAKMVARGYVGANEARGNEIG